METSTLGGMTIWLGPGRMNTGGPACANRNLVSRQLAGRVLMAERGGGMSNKSVLQEVELETLSERSESATKLRSDSLRRELRA